MEVIVIIGSLRGPKWTHLRQVLKHINFIEISNDQIYTSWNNNYIKTSSLLFDGISGSPQVDSVVDRPWFVSIVQRWCSSPICDYSLYLSECRKFEIALFLFLGQFSIRKCICLYGIAHHVWNNIAESALLNLGIQSIKFYPLLDTQYSILLAGGNEFNLPFEIPNSLNEFQPNLPQIYDVLVNTLIKSRPKYTSIELKHGKYYINSEKQLLINILKFALHDVKCFMKSFFSEQYNPFAFSPALSSNRYSLINKSINLVSQAHYISAYEQISQSVCLESMRGQLLLFAHFQPEATTSPEGGCTWNHLELIAKLKCTFPHLQIFYKEHPASALAFDSSQSPTDVGLCRSVAYLDALQALGVTVLDLDCSVTVEHMKIFDIIPVTIGGTVALQCAMNGHYAIYSGNPWYKNFSSALPLYHLDDINPDAFLESAKDNLHHDSDMLLAYFVDLMAPSLIPNVFGFGLGQPKSDNYYASARVKLLRVLTEI